MARFITEEAAQADGLVRAEPVHLLLGILAIQDGFSCKTLSDMDVPLGVLREQVADQITCKLRPQPKPQTAGHTATVAGILDLAVQEARAHGHHRVTSGHILIGLTCHERSSEAQLLAQYGAEPARTRRKVVELIEARPPRP